MIHFIQPAIPKYRVAFFNELSRSYQVEVQHSKIDFLDVKSVSIPNPLFKKTEVDNFISFFNRLYWQKGIRLFRYNKNDIVVISGNPRVINHMLLLFICKLRKVPVIWWGQGWTAGSYGFSSKVRLRLMSLADGVAVYTEDEAKNLSHIKNIVGLNNGLDIDSIRSIKDGSIKEKADNNLDKTLNLLFIGRLTEKSNINFLIKTIPLIKRDIHLHIIGDGPLALPIKRIIHNSNMSSKITLHGSIYEEGDISKIASLCDCFIYPGSVGLSLIHAYAYGLPAIVHNNKNDHMPEISAFIDGYNGVSFYYKDKSSLSSVIDGISESKLIEMKRNAYNTVTTTYNIQDMARRFSKLINLVTDDVI